MCFNYQFTTIQCLYVDAGRVSFSAVVLFSNKIFENPSILAGQRVSIKGSRGRLKGKDPGEGSRGEPYRTGKYPGEGSRESGRQASKSRDRSKVDEC